MGEAQHFHHSPELVARKTGRGDSGRVPEEVENEIPRHLARASCNIGLPSSRQGSGLCFMNESAALATEGSSGLCVAKLRETESGDAHLRTISELSSDVFNPGKFGPADRCT